MDVKPPGESLPEHRVGKRCCQSSWATVTRMCRFSFVLHELYFPSYFLLVHGNMLKGAAPSLADVFLQQQCFSRVTTSSATHVRPLAYSWYQTWVQYFDSYCWIFWADFASSVLFTSYFFMGHLSLPLSTPSIHRLAEVVRLSWNLVFMSLFTSHLKVMGLSVY